MLDQRRLDAKREARRKEGSEAEARGIEGAKPEALQDAPKPSGREIALDLGGVGGTASRGEGSGASGEAAPAAAPKGDFSALLAERLKEAWNGEIVQSAHIVLKDGDSGVIRLRMRPESLGNVKIELNLADNSISGKIVVESDEAKSAFERNMAELGDAFRQGGFESAKLEVSVGSGGSGKGGAEGRAAGSEGPFWSERRRADAFGGGVPAAGGIHGSGALRAVDILA